MRFSDLISVLAVLIALFSLIAILSSNTKPGPATFIFILAVWLLFLIFKHFRPR